VLVFLIVRAALGGVVVPAIAALVFALHPIQVESVTWISQRKTLMGSAGALTAILCHLEYGRTGRAAMRWASVGALAFAVMSKPTAMFVPIVLVLLDIWPLRRISLRTVREKWPHFIIMIAAVWIAYHSQREAAGMGVPNWRRGFDLLKLIAFNLSLYTKNLVWPTDLRLIYGLPTTYSWT